MRNPSRRPAVAALCGLVVCAFAMSSTMTNVARAAGPMDKVLPENTFVYFEVKNVAELRDAIASTQFGRMMSDSAMKPLMTEIKEKLAMPNAEVKEKLGLDLYQILDLPQGGVSVAVTPRDNAEIPVGLLITADAGKNNQAMLDLMNKLTSLAKEDGKLKVTKETAGKTAITVLSREGEKMELAWANVGSVYHIALGADTIKDALKNSAGREESLAKSDNFVKVKKKIGDSDIFFYIDVNAVIKQIAEAAPNGNAQQVEAILQTLGVNNLKAISGGVKIGGGQFESVSKFFVLTPKPAQGILRMFQMPKIAMKPEAWAPANAATYSSLSWDLDEMYEAVNDMVNMFAPGAIGALEGQIGGGGQPISFQKDFFGPLGDRVTMVSTYKQPPKPENQQILVGVALEDAKAFQSTIAKVLKLVGADPKKREFQGATIWDFPIPDEIAQNLQGMKIEAVSMAIARNTLFISTAPSVLENAIRGGGPTLAESPKYRAIAKFFPETTSQISYQEPEQAARAAYAMIKEGGLDNAFDAARATGAKVPKLGDLMDLDKVPGFDFFKKFIAPSGSFWSMDDDGLIMTNFTVKSVSP